MSNVHEEITKHSKAQHQVVRTFVELDNKREHFIEEAVTLAQQGNSFSVEKINKVTAEINELSRKGIVPQRKFVTVEMVKEYVNRKSQNK
ncbi:DUF2533 family protein [Fredinandcohnia humi]